MAAPDDSWLVEAMCQFVNSPAWNDQLLEFINANCEMFDNFQEENKHEYVEVHRRYKDIIDNLLAAHLMEIGMEPDEFEQKVLEAGLMDDPRLERVVGQLLAAEDFIKFKDMMVNHHTAMQKQAEHNYNQVVQTEADIADALAIEAAQRELENEATAAAIAAASRPAAPPPAARTARAAPVASSSAGGPAGIVPVAPTVMPTASEEAKFAAGGGTYGRASYGMGARKPPSNEKSAAIRRALVGAIRPA